MRKRQNLQAANNDFRRRYAQRDLEISRNEYEYLKDRYLASKSVQEDSEEASPSQTKAAPQEKQQPEKKQEYNFDVNIPSIKDLGINEFKSTSDLYKKPEGKKNDAPAEKQERHLDIKLPSIQSLIDEYTMPYYYDHDKGRFVQEIGSRGQMQALRETIQNRPTPRGITAQEESYLRGTDPVKILNDTRTLHQINKQLEVDNALDTMSDIASAPFEVFGDAVRNKVREYTDKIFDKNRDYIDNIISTWNISKNNVEFDTYVDSNIRLGEKKQYADIIQMYNDNIKQYVELQNQYDASTNKGERHNLLIAMNNILAQNDKLRNSVDEAVTYDYDSSVGSGVVRGIADFISSTLDNPIMTSLSPVLKGVKDVANAVSTKGIITNDVGSYGKRLVNLLDSNRPKPGESLSEDFLKSFYEISDNISKSNKDFQQASDKQIAKDKIGALKNKQEAMDWEAWHTPSKEFKAKEKAAQDNYLLDADTYKYGIWTVLGSSASFNGTQLLSTGLDWLGAGLLMAPNPYAKVAGAVSTAAGGATGLLSGVYENRAEITQNYIKGLRDDLDKAGKLSKFLDEGKKQLEKKNIAVREDDDVFRHFILKDYKVNDPVIQELALRHMFGANNAFQNDMMAVSADVAVNTGINVFGATGQVAEALKIFPEGSKFAFLRKVAQDPILSKGYKAAQKMSTSTIASAISPLANIPYNIAIKPVMKGVKSAITPMVEAVGKEMDTLISWAKIAPKTLFRTGTAGKYTIDFLGKTAARGYSESIEEGKQYEYGNQFAEGKFKGKSNTMLGTLIDDLSTGLYTGLAFIGNQFLGMQADRELMSNMRGGFIGGILNHGTMISAVQNYTNGRGELKAGDIVFNNVMAEKLRQRSNIINGEEMGKYTSRSGYVAMMNAFDRIQKIHDHITEDASDKVGLTQEELSNQRNMFRRIAALSNDKKVIDRATALGIKQNSADFRKLVSLINTADEIQTQNINEYNSLVEQARQVLEQDGLSLNVEELFRQARATAKSADEMDLINKAEDWARWAQPLNNQILGQYAALNKLIDELQEREEFLTEAERRNLNHYIAQRERLDKTVAEIREGLGSIEHMDFLNYGDPDILTKYSQIYRTLYQASAQLETSSRVLDALYGKNNSADLADDFVKEQLDFINERIDDANKQKKGAIKASKKSPRNESAKKILQDYKNSVEDDVEFMAELANRFDEESYNANNRLDFGGQPETEEAIKEEDTAEENPGAQNLPASIYDKVPTEGKQFPVGTVITTEDEPGSTFTVTDLKVNPSTGQYLLEAVNDKGETRTIGPDEINGYQKLLPPPPADYSSVLPNSNRIQFAEDSPFAKAMAAAKALPDTNIVSKTFKDELEDTLRIVISGSVDDNESQLGTIAQLQMLNDVANIDAEKPVYSNPLYGQIYKTKSGYTFVSPYRKTINEIYNEWPDRKNGRVGIVSKLSNMYQEGKTNEIKTYLSTYNIDPLFNNVLDSVAALNSIANQILDYNNQHTAKWISDIEFYTRSLDGNNNPVQNKVSQLLNSDKSVTMYNVKLGFSNVDVTADAISVDRNGNISVYVFAFPKHLFGDYDMKQKSPNQVRTRQEYYNDIADILFHVMPEYLQKKVKGIYVLPIIRNDQDETQSMVGNPVQLAINDNINYREINKKFTDYTVGLGMELATFNQQPIPQPKTKPEPEGDGSIEQKIQDIKDYVQQVEQSVANVFNGSFSFNGMIRKDMRTYLDGSRHVLTKYRRDLKQLSQSDEINELISKIEGVYARVLSILQAYGEGSTYNSEDLQYEGETVKANRIIIPDNHPLMARSTSGIPVTATSDFITNGKIELVYGWYNPSTKQLVKSATYSTYPGTGVYAIITYNGVKYEPVFIQPSHYKNGVQPYTTEGAQFVQDIINLQNQANGLSIICDAKRQIPNPIYRGSLKPILEIKALHLTEDDIQELSGDSDNIGMANINNDVQHLNRKEDKSFLWRFAGDQAGSVFLFYSFNFKEYDDGGQIPIKLIPAKLKKSDVDVIINILKQNGLESVQGNRSVMNSRYILPNGKESPFTNAQVLMLLTAFELSHNDQSLFWVDDFGKVYFKQRKSDPTPVQIDVNTTEGENKLRGLLSNGYEIAQNRDILSANLGNPSDKMFGNLKQWIADNGILSISDNLIFDSDDVNRNNKGFFGIGWSIRHGRLLSNLSSIYEPSVSVSDPKIDNGAVTQKVQQPAQDEPKPVNRVKPRGTFGGLMDTDYDFGEAFAPNAVEELPEEALDEADAMEDFKRMLGDAAVEFKDEILGILKGGLKILGKTYAHVIEMSRLAGTGTQFHEAFHRILELVVSPEVRERIYKAFSNLHPEVDSTDPRSITEGLAEDFKAFALDEKTASKWKKIWKRIKMFCQTLINADKRVLYKMYRDVYKGKYKNIEPSPENIERFNRIFRVEEEEQAVLYHQVYDSSTGERINLPNVPSAFEYRMAIDDIVNALVANSGASIFGQNVNDIVFTKEHIVSLKDGSVYRSFVGDTNPDDINKIFIDIFDNWDRVLGDVAVSLKRFGLHFKHNINSNTLQKYKTTLQEEEEEAIETADEGKAKTADINQYELQDYEISKLRKMSDRTKYFFAVIPNVRFVNESDEGIPMYVNEKNANGEEIDNKGRVILTDKETGLRYVETEDGQIILEKDLTINKVRNIIPELDGFGFQSFAPFSLTCKIALNKCYSANSLDDMLNLFRKVSEEHPQFVIIANRFASLINNMKRTDKDGHYITKDGSRYRRMDNGLYQQVIGKDKYGDEYFTQDELDFDINYNNQAMAVSIFNNISGTRLHFRTIRSARPSKESITFQSADTDNGYSAMRYTQSWHSTFLSDVNKVYTKEIQRNGEYLVEYYAKNANLFKNVAAGVRKLVNAYSDRRSEEYKSGTVVINGKQILVNKNPEAVKEAYIQLLNQIGIAINVDEFNHLLMQLYNKTDANALRRYFQQDGEDSVQSQGVSISRFILAIEQGVDEHGKLTRIITSGSFYSRIGAVTQLADAIWSYNQSLSDLMTTAPGKNKYYQVANRNAQDLMLQELNTPNSDMLRDLYKSAYHRGSILIDALKDGDIVLESYTHAGYESDNKSDFGSDFMQITNSEDIIAKMTPLLEGNIVPPTLSNKKTYQPIRIIDTETGKPIHLPGIEYIANKNNAQTQNAEAEVYSANNIPVLTDKTFEGQIVTTGLYAGKQFELSDDVYDALIRYAFSEYYSIKENLERLKTIPESEKVYNFDVGTKGTKNPGGVRFARFYEIYLPKRKSDGSIEYDTIPFNDDTVSPEDNLKKAEEYFFGNDISQEYRKAVIKEIISRRLDDNLEYLRQNGIIRYRNNWRKIKDKYSRYEPVAIDTNYLNAIIKAYGNSFLINGPISARSIATCALILDVSIKHQIGMEEYQRLFAGHPGLYVSLFDDGQIVDDTQDLSKRLGGHMSTGETECRLDDVPTVYTCAELKDYKVTSSQNEDLKRWFDESESRLALYADKQNELFIYHQNLRNDALNIVDNIKIKTQSDIDAILDNINNEEYREAISYWFGVARTADKDKLKFAKDQIDDILYDYKHSQISEEYKRQSALSLDNVKNELQSRGLLTGVNTRVAAYCSSFVNKINVADGASYVSPIMVKYMLQSIGKFDRKVSDAWNQLYSGKVTNVLSNAQAYKTITDALFGTQKYTATGYRMNGNQPIFYYNKTALFPLFKSISYGRTGNILDQMDKDGVHMLMFESAVKFGSQGKQSFPTTKEELDNFHFNTYQQDFKWLRKQLNTDPKESDLMAIGTQTKKIALTILDIYKDDYVKRDGSIENGMKIRDRIFECERVLCNLGTAEFLRRFSSVQEMSKYLLDNLSERDASSMMLEGLSLTQDPETGELQMNAPLEALSNSGWIQSIITSLANKNIIDVNLPGSAFIQRSVYAMEDGNILGDSQVNDIPKLKISNDWSSMDAVVSIDFFYQQFPQLEEMPFYEARQWLIDHNVIGENAKADTVAYRIPTQANSSIHALRFVDVISTVRDTIILPEEFTAITGSDFDIDKLFLSTKYFNINEDGSVSTEFNKEEQPKKHWGNELLECYLELLTQPKEKYANQLTRSIDFDTEIPKSVVKLLKEGNTKHIGTYDALQLSTQCRIKSENRTGGIGVGPYALNNNNAIISRLFEVECENVGLIKALDISRLYGQLDVEGNTVMATIGAFISGHVDIAKDPWVTILNINEYTYDIHIFLARAGLGLRALWFCAQPIMRKLADVNIQAGGYLFDNTNESPYIRKRKAIQQFETDYLLGGTDVQNTYYSQMLNMVKNNTNFYQRSNPSENQKNIQNYMQNAVYIIQQIFGVDPSDPSKKINTFKDASGNTKEGTILQDIALHHNTEESIFDPTNRYIISAYKADESGQLVPGNIYISVKDVQFFVYLANIMLDDAVSDMKKLVQYSKIETKKQGKNRAEQFAYDRKYSAFFQNGITKIMIPKTVSRLAWKSSINEKQTNFMGAMHEVLKDQMLEYTSGYEQMLNEFIFETNTPVTADTIRSILNGFTSYQKYEYIQQYAKANNINLRDLFVGSNSIYNEISRIVNKILEYPATYDRYTDGNGRITNTVLARLKPSYIPRDAEQEYGKDLPKFVDFQINKDDSSAFANDFEAGWQQMLEDEEHPDLQNFARRLIVYAFMTSGDTNKFGSFFNYVPYSWRNVTSRNDLGQTYIQYIKSLLNDYSDIIGTEDNPVRLSPRKENVFAFIDILRNNWGDDSLVPTIQETSKDQLGNTVNNYYEYNIGGEPLLIALIKTTIDDNGVRRFYEATTEQHRAVIKIHNYNSNSYKNPQDFKLYRFVRMGSIVNSNGEIVSFPIYGRISQTGGVMYGHTIIQYGDDLNFGWEGETRWYTEKRDLMLQEGMAQIEDALDTQINRNYDQVKNGRVTVQELKENAVKMFDDIPIKGSYEDDSTIDFTVTTTTQFYNMAKVMGQWNALYGKKPTQHNRSIQNMPLAAHDKKTNAINKWNDIRNSEFTATHGVTIDSDIIHNYTTWLANNPNGIVAYRVNKATYTKPESVQQGIVGNPFDVVTYGEQDAVTFFFDWIVNNNSHGEEKATDEFRNAIIDKINSIDIPNILYYKEWGHHSHATALGYIIENKNTLLTKQETKEEKKEPQKIDIWSTNRNRYANLSNVAVRPMLSTTSIAATINKHFNPSSTEESSNIIENIIKLMKVENNGIAKFNSVEQMFQLVKFEAIAQHVKEKAKELYNISRLDIAKAKTREAAAVKGILVAIRDAQKNIISSTGSTITSIAHKQLPDINNIVESFFTDKWNEGGPNNVVNSTAYDIIREIMLQSFLQNPGSARLLLSTEDAILTHDKGGVYWKVGFPEALMSVRDEIRNNYNDIQEVQNTIVTMLGGDEMAYKEVSTAIKAAKQGMMFSDVESFFTEEEANQIKQAIPNMGWGKGKGNLSIVSASRHTDPVFYATRIIEMLRENAKKPFTDPSRINVLELWSKHDGIPMQNILEACKKYRVAPIVSFSITSLGGTTIEPGVMKHDDLLDNIQKLIDVGILDPRTTTFRTDPILPGVSSVEDIRHIIERGVKMGIRKFVTSPMQTYDTQTDAKGRSRSVIPYINAALTKDKSAIVKYPGVITSDGIYNWDKVYGLYRNQIKFPGKYAFAPKKEYMKPYVDMFEEMMSKYNILIQSCAVPVGNLQPSACLDPEIIEAVTSIKVNGLFTDETRPFCNCYGSHSDMFRYDDVCRSSCGYCYGGQMNTSPIDYYDEDGKLKDFAYSKVNEYADLGEGPAEVIIKNNKYTYNEGSVVDASGNQVDDDTKYRVIWKRAVDVNKAKLVSVNGIYYVVTTSGLIFNWGTARVEQINDDKLKKKILSLAQDIYENSNVSTLFNAAELKQLGESRRELCNRNR